MGLSAVIIVFNEEANIEECLQNLSFVDEIVIVDSFSTDRTLEIARKYTDKIVQREFKGFSDQRNAALELAQHEWVLIIDADEKVTDSLAVEIKDAISKGEYDSYKMPRLTWFCSKPIRHCGWYPDYQVRVVRKSKLSFPPRLVHEKILVDGSCGVLKNDLLHYSYRNTNDYTRKMVQYSRKAADQKILDGYKFRMSDLVFRPVLAFFKFYILRQGFRDGLHGFILSGLSASSIFLRYAMLWDKTRGKKGDAV